MTGGDICPACGQPKLIPLAMLNCYSCGAELNKCGGRRVVVKGVCTPYCFACANVAAGGDNALEGAQTEARLL